MTLATHGDQKYQNSEKLAETSDWPTLSIEHRKFEAGRQATPVPDLHGSHSAAVRRRDGLPERQR